MSQEETNASDYLDRVTENNKEIQAFFAEIFEEDEEREPAAEPTEKDVIVDHVEIQVVKVSPIKPKFPIINQSPYIKINLNQELPLRPSIQKHVPQTNVTTDNSRLKIDQIERRRPTTLLTRRLNTLFMQPSTSQYNQNEPIIIDDKFTQPSTSKATNQPTTMADRKHRQAPLSHFSRKPSPNKPSNQPATGDTSKEPQPSTSSGASTSKHTHGEPKQSKLMDEDPMLDYHKEKEPESETLNYRGSYPPNRYNIPPGHKWDGVDRSNGFEKRFLEQKAKEKAKEKEDYKRNVKDM